MKFKVGDFVKVVSLNSKDPPCVDEKINIGLIGIISQIDDVPPNILIDPLNGGESAWVYEEEIKHARVPYTKIARKLYQNNIDKVEDGWIYLKN